ALSLHALASHRLLDRLQLLEQRFGGEVGLDLDHAVDEPRLRVAERLALVQGRGTHDARAWEPGDLLDGLRGVHPPVTDIRPDADGPAVRHARSRPLLGGGVPGATTSLARDATRLDRLDFVAFLRQANHDCRVLLTDSALLYNPRSCARATAGSERRLVDE